MLQSGNETTRKGVVKMSHNQTKGFEQREAWADFIINNFVAFGDHQSINGEEANAIQTGWYMREGRLNSLRNHVEEQREKIDELEQEITRLKVELDCTKTIFTAMKGK